MIEEELIEFVDWSKVLPEDITTEIKEKFESSVDGLKIYFWFEEFLNCLIIKLDEIRYPNCVFFFDGSIFCMELNKENGGLCCSAYFWDKFADINPVTFLKTQLEYKLKQNIDPWRIWYSAQRIVPKWTKILTFKEFIQDV